jgi:cysteine desulfurase
MNFAPTYLDWNATTPLDPAVREAMLPWLGAAEPARFGNASSRHEYGRQARAAVDEARARVAAAAGAHATEVIFTSGGSEANNLFIKGAAASLRPGVVAVSAIEHPCVREPARQLRRSGWTLREIAVDALGVVEAADWGVVLASRPGLVSVMLANNETGVLQDVAVLAREARAAGAWFHTDAVQALGKVAVDFRALGVHAMTLSAHKIGGPIGAGALVVDKRVELSPLIAGGGQERGLRSGTENVAAIVGFGVACERAVARREAEAARLAGLRDELLRCARRPRRADLLGGCCAPAEYRILRGRGHRRRDPGRPPRPCRLRVRERLCLLEREPRTVSHPAGDGRGARAGACRGACEPRSRHARGDVRSFIETFVRVTDELKNLASIGA